MARSGLTASARTGDTQRSHRRDPKRRWWWLVVAVLWRPPGAPLYGGGGRNFEIVPTSPDRGPVALGLSAGLVHLEKCEKIRNPTTGRSCFGLLPPRHHTKGPRRPPEHRHHQPPPPPRRIAPMAPLRVPGTGRRSRAAPSHLNTNLGPLSYHTPSRSTEIPSGGRKYTEIGL